MIKEEYKNKVKEYFKAYMLDMLEDSLIINNISYTEILELCNDVLNELKTLNKNKKLNNEITKYFKY